MRMSTGTWLRFRRESHSRSSSSPLSTDRSCLHPMMPSRNTSQSSWATPLMLVECELSERGEARDADADESERARAVAKAAVEQPARHIASRDRVGAGHGEGCAGRREG